VGLVLQYGHFRALLTGDAEIPTLRAWLSEGAVPNVNLVKVGHHGSNNATIAAWVAASDPEVAVISVGRNSYGHPSPRVLRLWSAPHRRVFRTDLHGDVTVRGCRDGTMSVTTSRADGRVRPTHTPEVSRGRR
jgi:competence protein ComEC